MRTMTTQQYEVLKSAVMADVREGMEAYGTSSMSHYLRTQDFTSLQELVTWRITAKVYGGELSPDSKVKVVGE